ncbi:MAG: undecaprenyldiphospho-muramoylpentapeptide beta-N-acetylglucosaminyltransferase [Proteobacteria bacterium]|nr:undecaprenyldiphospho-muramoylpentapeptide beta-N-acetylglucosaminyltransferase [Pseudomonadota bacterium]
MSGATTATVMITTGGTGGHVFPGLAVASHLARAGARVFWLGTREGIEADLVPKHGVEFEGVPFRGVRGKGWRTLASGPFALAAACRESLTIMQRRRPDVVLGFGGFASFPGAAMGAATRRPLVLHDANAVAGLANRMLAYRATRLCVGFPGAYRGRHAAKVVVTGNPLRDAITALPPPAARWAGREGPLRLLVVGGSLGARALNDVVPAALARLDPGARPQVVHQAGVRHIDALRAAYAQHGVDGECVAFIDDMAARYAWADYVIARGGGLTVAELAAVGLPSLLVPLPGAIADEQTANAQFLVAAGAATCRAQDRVDAAWLGAHLATLTRDAALTMAEAAYAVGRRDAAARIAGLCLEYGPR